MSRLSIFGKSGSKASVAAPPEPTEPTPAQLAAAAEASARRKLEAGVITTAEFQEVLAMNARLHDASAQALAEDAEIEQRRAEDDARLAATTEAASDAHGKAKGMLLQGLITQVRRV
jgi:hypothetical protein